MYTSSSAFTVSEVLSWQLCFETIKLINKELNDSADLLSECKLPLFDAIGVLGAKSAVALAEYIPTDGWRPLPTDIHVSNVPKLARTLGGRELYSYPFAPIRELIQNAADAIEARAAIDDDFKISEGRVLIRVAKSGANSTLIEVEDNGIGMSEMTLTGALLDFGLSFWRSDASRKEFPGLQSKFLAPRGRYGIGFFSIFMWSENIKVSSRLFNRGRADATILEFNEGIGERPIARNPVDSETSNKFTTKISLVVNNKLIERTFSPIDRRSRLLSEGSAIMSSLDVGPSQQSWQDVVRQISGALQIEVYVEMEGRAELVNLPEWKTAPLDSFLDFYEKLTRPLSKVERRFGRAASEIRNAASVIGRAFLLPDFSNRYQARGVIIYERGIFVGARSFGKACGILEGSSQNAAREIALSHNLITNDEWVNTQKDYLFRISQNIGEILASQDALLVFGTYNENYPLVLVDRKIMSIHELKEFLGGRNIAKLTLEKGYSSPDFTMSKVSEVAAFIGNNIDPDKIYFLTNIPGGFSEEMDIESLRKNESLPPSHILFFEILDSLGPNPVFEFSVDQKDTYSTTKHINIRIKRAKEP